MPDSAATAAHLLETARARRVFPAAVAEVGSGGGVLWRQPFGTLTFDADAAATDIDTIFDLASLTKPMATTSVGLRLADRGALHLDDRVSTICPEWAGADREDATLRHLLEHSAGLSARLLDRPPRDRRSFEHEICTMPLEYSPGSRSIYSDLGFILLGFCLERRGDASLADQVQELLSALLDAGGALPGSRLLAAIPAEAVGHTAPTRPLPEDERRGRRLVGKVHDNYAAALGGFAGHAGLFGTAAGVGTFARTALRAARNDLTLWPPFTPAAMRRATAKSVVPGSSRALGWDTMLPTSSCGSRLSASAFGHVGFTGTSLWIDPQRDRYYVLLTNRACDGGTTEQMQEVRRAFHDIVSAM
jgi:CubicO group peptidase (beta-lactamase class C family)